MSLRDNIKHRMLTNIQSQRSVINTGDRHTVRKIDDDVHTYTNGLNITIAKQGGGKTFWMLRDAIAASVALPETHLIIVATKKASDETVEANIHAAACPILLVSYEGLIEALEVLLASKNTYNGLMRQAVDAGISIQQLPHEVDDVDALFQALQIDDFSRPWLQTIVILDDVGSSRLLRNLDSFVNNRLKLARDDNIIWYLGVHSLNDLSPTIKANADIIAIGRGLTAERLNIIYRQLNSGLDEPEFNDIYRAMDNNGARFLTVDNRAQSLCYD
jgi:hypothetical protein